MTIDLVPLKQFSERIAQGWTMVDGYPLQPGDYAVTMQAPSAVCPIKSNLGRAAIHRNKIAQENRRERARQREREWA